METGRDRRIQANAREQFEGPTLVNKFEFARAYCSGSRAVGALAEDFKESPERKCMTFSGSDSCENYPLSPDIISLLSSSPRLRLSDPEANSYFYSILSESSRDFLSCIARDLAEAGCRRHTSVWNDKMLQGAGDGTGGDVSFHTSRMISLKFKFSSRSQITLHLISENLLSYNYVVAFT